MRFKLAALVLAASCLPAIAQPPIVNALTPQGYISAVRGLAHIEEGAEGTYIHLEIPGATRTVVGFIPFGDEPTFSNLKDIEGRTVEIAGVVVLDGAPMIIMTDQAQLAIIS